MTHGLIFLLMFEFATVASDCDILWIIIVDYFCIIVLFHLKMSKNPDAGGDGGGESDVDGFELCRIGTLPENYGTLLICYYDATNMLLIT